MGKRKGGPVPKLTPKKQQVIVKSIAAGVPRAFAAMQAGVSERCLYKWLAQGRKGGKKNEAYVQLVQALQKAEADAVARNVALVQKAGSKSWQAAAWWLERRYPEDFALRYRREIEEAAAKAVERALKNGTPSPAPPPSRQEGTEPAEEERGPDPSDV